MPKPDNIRLSLSGLPIIETLDDLSDLTHVSKYTLYQLSKNAHTYYKLYCIPKKSGGFRQICQPSKKLKGIQAWILTNILYKLDVSPSCKGFEVGSSIAANVEPHKFSNAVLSLDIKDFFPTINRKKVYNVFKSVGYNSLISTILTNFCTYEDSLPQGSPCSPRLANLTAWTLDVRIGGYAGKRGITYTRYADDLTFSGLNPLKVIQVYPTIKKIIEDEGFYLNSEKTRMAGALRPRKVTGLILYDNSFGIGRKLLKKIRAKINSLTLPSQQSNLMLLNETVGWLSYINSVDKKRLNSLKQYIEKLKLKYPLTLVKELYK